MTTPENSPDSTPKNEQCSFLEPPKRTLAEYAELIVKHYGLVQESEKESIRIGRTTIQAAITCGQFANEAKGSGLISYGQWEKWVGKNCKCVGIRNIQKWMKLADYAKQYPKEIADCTNLKEAEIVCGVRPPPKPTIEKNKEIPTSGTETQIIPEIILREMQRQFEHIQRQYGTLTKVDPELNRFLLGKGYDNDLPLLLQQWQSSLNDALAYFNLPPVAPDVCVRCGHAREWDELFVPISAYYPLQHLQSFNQWCQQCEADYDYDFEKRKFGKKHIIEDLPKAIKELTDNLNTLKSLDVRDYTLALKLDQLKEITVAKKSVIKAAERNVWAPADLNNEQDTIAAIERLFPEIVIVKDKAAHLLWSVYRHFVSSAVNYPTPGRFIKFFVVDASQSKKPVLGIGAISGDFPALGPRDDFIGWTKEQKEGGKLNHTAVASTIVSTQPFGFNFNGGKLIAALITSQQIRDEWQSQYGDVLSGMSTTSLFGVPSMYDRIAEWKRLGVTTGRVPIQMKPDIYRKWLEFLKYSRAHEFQEMMTQDADVSGPVTNYKTKVLTMIYKAAGLKLADFQHGHRRGIYFSEFYENTRDFLCGKVPEDNLKMKRLFQESVQQITERWREKAIKRYQTLKAKGALKPEKPSYSQLGKMDFQAARTTFIDDVGR